jgi:hypothetical protein
MKPIRNRIVPITKLSDEALRKRQRTATAQRRKWLVEGKRLQAEYDRRQFERGRAIADPE